MQVKEQLSPAEKVLDDITTLMKPMESQLGELKELLKNGLQKAQDSQEKADKAEEDTAAANQVTLLLFMLLFVYTERRTSSLVWATTPMKRVQLS